MLGIIVVDPQYDFFPGGSLAVKEGDQIIGPINRLFKKHPAAPVFITRDWHPPVTKHFKAGGGIWVPHCVQETTGAMFHKDLFFPPEAIVYSKGTDPQDDGGYSGFDGVQRGGNTLLQDLSAQNVDEVIVCGLATDYCVKATVMDGLKAGLKIQLHPQGMRPVNLKDDDGTKAYQAMLDAGATEYAA